MYIINTYFRFERFVAWAVLIFQSSTTKVNYLIPWFWSIKGGGLIALGKTNVRHSDSTDSINNLWHFVLRFLWDPPNFFKLVCFWIFIFEIEIILIWSLFFIVRNILIVHWHFEHSDHHGGIYQTKKHSKLCSFILPKN